MQRRAVYHLTQLYRQALHSSLLLRGFKTRYRQHSQGHMHSYIKHNVRARQQGTVFIFHGMGSSALDYGELAAYVSKHVERVIAFDVPGHGKSSPVQYQDITDILKILQHELCTYGKQGPTVAFGNSMGGYIATYLAMQEPHAFDHLVLSSPAGAPVTPEQLADLQRVFALENDPTAEEFIDRIFARPPRGALRRIYRHAVRNQFERPYLKELMRSIQTHHSFTREQIEKLTIPTDVYWGSVDRLLPTENALFWKQCRNVTFHDVPNEGHMPFFERKSMVGDWIIQTQTAHQQKRAG